MAKIALASCDVATLKEPSGDAGTFVTQFARLLKKDGDDVSIILARAESDPMAVDLLWRENHRSWGIDVIDLPNRPPASNRLPDIWLVRLSEQVAPLLGAFDVVYFIDRANVAFHAVRTKRFSSDPIPVCVTILLGPSEWFRSCNRVYPGIPEDSNLDFIERYGALHSDFVVAPSQYIVDRAKNNGWEFRRKPEVLGLPYGRTDSSRSSQPARRPRRIAFYSPLLRPEGMTLLVNSLKELSEQSPKALRGLKEVVILGREDEKSNSQWVRSQLKQTGLRVTQLRNFDRAEAQDFLVKNAQDTLVIFPSPADNFCYAVIEASLIPSLNLLCSREGGISEIFADQGGAQLMFAPVPHALAAKLRERLESPLAPGQVTQYEFGAANERWLAFHHRACEQKQASRHLGATVRESNSPYVDVCVAYSDEGRHFPQLLESLDHQTSRHFNVIAVDHSAPNSEARAVFDAMSERYSSRGWTFFHHSGQSVAARNEAAKRARGEYLLMVDATDVLALHAVERMLEAARLSGDDCLASASCLFCADGFPYDPDTGELDARPSGYSVPLGANLVAALLEPTLLSGPMLLIRRQVFEAVGGYREAGGAAQNLEMHVRLALAGYQTDVVPDYLIFHRQSSEGGAPDGCTRNRSLIDTYDRHLASVGLYGVAGTICDLYQSSQDIEKQARGLERLVQYSTRRFQVLGPGPQDNSGEKRFADDDEGPLVIRLARRAYRRLVPLKVRHRLLLDERVMKLIGRDQRP
jgi:GT2 family glycosyltransferase